MEEQEQCMGSIMTGKLQRLWCFRNSVKDCGGSRTVSQNLVDQEQKCDGPSTMSWTVVDQEQCIEMWRIKYSVIDCNVLEYCGSGTVYDCEGPW